MLLLCLGLSSGWMGDGARVHAFPATRSSSGPSGFLQEARRLASTASPPVEEAERRVPAVRRRHPVTIDGRLDEAAWEQAPVIDRFLQRDPVEGAPPTERTAVRVLFDDDALYVGARLYDSAPDSIVARLGRRDADLESDRFVVFIDPFYDRRTGYYFGVNAAGTLYDGVLMNDDWDDDAWDGVWEGKVHLDEAGWSVEMRIPYSQLRFHRKDRYVWGINFRRDISRKNESDYLVYTPRQESGFVSRFYDLVGMEDITPRRQVEVMPYLTARAEFTDQPRGNPFDDGSRYVPGVGVDLKVGLTSNLTLNATVNPDFGQVEVDPAVVNLSDIETFFPEKRPFFIEGASVFNFGRGGASSNWGFNWGNPAFFYSRRIGRAPQGSLPEHDYADVSDGVRILGAAKLTGRIGSANVGTIQALTERGVAGVARGAERFSAEVEPLAYYGVFRAQQEFNEGRQALGFLGTVAQRDFREDWLRDEVNQAAYGFGLDGWTFLDDDRVWVLTGWLGATHVRGTRARMLALQQSALHYFQRPDLGAVAVDSNATGLTGTAGRLALNKQRGRFTVNAALGFISPGFDVNDLGFMWRTNVVNGHLATTLRWTDPTPWYRRLFWNAAVFRSLDFDGNTTWTGVWTSGFIQFLNYYGLWVMVAVNPETVNNTRTRGGPLTRNPPGVELGLEFETDSRKPLVFTLNAFTYRQPNEGNLSFGPGIEYKPASNLSLRVSPQLSLNREFAQYVGQFDDPTATHTFGKRYVFAELDQVTLSTSIRLNWTFTPTMSFQLFAQPFISSGDYAHYKELARPKSYDFITYGEAGTTFDPATRVADPDGEGPAPPLELPDLDFNFKSLRGTAVFRWEYRPGSTLFLVWTQARSDTEEHGEFRFSHSLRRLFDVRPDNIFMVKLTYWLSR
ncbi:carbohydrate binding family 9 domain-containing protein [Rhodocaloribacter litoris]|uniref:DUF5916 domain-containing protein n=1 Tax=Rhodocaloribacter litoris TaxID=2558931 RepID=UPI00141DE858|nr:DUF5916 domain-containing protein [Rhodocaloribacter litoris]QXD15069.1 carbohydrate binding family 9 domain-containing protein [Rhodocaloribacter litoris]